MHRTRNIIQDAVFGNIETFSHMEGQYKISGWAVCYDEKDELISPSEIVVMNDEKELTRSVPTINRADIAERFRCKANENHFGFSFSFPFNKTTSYQPFYFYSTLDGNTFFPLNWESCLMGRPLLDYKYSLIKTYMSRTVEEIPLNTVNNHDTMYDTRYKNSAERYYETGKSAVVAIIHGLLSSNTLLVRDILDIPCGHGRVARHLRKIFPYALIDCCDIDREGVDFCSAHFNARGIYADQDIRKTPFDRKYDLIWIGSMFTHFDEKTTLIWLERLLDLLTPQGIVVATLHGRKNRAWLKEGQYDVFFDEQGKAALEKAWQLSEWGYCDYVETGEETDATGGGKYGFSLCPPVKIFSMLKQFPEYRVFSFTESGWAANQDVIVLGRYDL